MMRLPALDHRRPTSLSEALSILQAEGDRARPIAGGTDLVPKLKRRQLDAPVLVSLSRVPELLGLERTAGGGWRIGAGTKLVELGRSAELRESHRALWQAAVQVASPPIRSAATLGGNLCVDTRCFWYDQTAEWRRAVGYCLKRDGDTCRVAPNSPRCWAVSSTDTAPALIALGASARIASAAGERVIPLSDLYGPDGIAYLQLQPGELLVDVQVPPSGGWQSSFWKLRRRLSIDFPLVSVAAAVRLSEDAVVEEARIVLGAVDCAPVDASDAAASLLLEPLSDAALEAAARIASKHARPMETSDLPASWRRKVIGVAVRHALREIRGEDVTAERRRYGPQALLPA